MEEDAQTYLQRGVNYLRMGQPKMAIAEFDDALRLTPNMVEARFQRANAHRLIGKFENARADYEHALRTRPNHAETHLWLGTCFANSRDDQNALENYSKAIDLNPYLIEAYLQRARQHYKQSRFEEARTDLEAALTLDADLIDAQEFLKVLMRKVPKDSNKTHRKKAPPEQSTVTLTTQKPPFDISKAFPQLTTATTVRLHPRLGQEFDIMRSKLSGEIVWPSGEAWPICSTHADVFVPVLQLSGTDFPELELLSGKNLLQILWCPNDHSDWQDCPAVQIFLRNDSLIDSQLPTIPKPKTFRSEFKPAPCALKPERVIEYPSAYELDPGLLEKIDAWIENQADTTDEWTDPLSYQYIFSTAPGTKIGGHVNWLQDPTWPVCGCGQQMRHLLTIASSEFDGESYRRWCPLEEQHMWMEQRHTLFKSIPSLLGDGSLYLFVCRFCSPWTFKSVYQR